MIKSIRSKAHSGFTLIELVIVLGITGLIFSGLWGLLTSGSSQLQAQSAAQQYRQVIDATRKYVTSGTVPYISGQPPGLVAPAPTIADLQAANLLSPNFSTTDSYGNTILIAVNTIDADKQQYRFVVYSNRNVTISDKAGAQISSLIGSEGGFVYANATDGCSNAVTAESRACGSFNSFSLLLNDFLIPAGAGRIVALAYTIDTNMGIAPWLYRKGGSTPEQNTMQQDMFFIPGLTLRMQNSAIEMGAGNLVMGGGNLSMGNNGAAAGGGSLFLGGGPVSDMSRVTGDDIRFTTAAAFRVISAGSVNITSGTSTIVATTDISPAAVALDINGTGRANEFQAGRFIYSSDISMKENIVPIPDALNKLLQLHGYSFDWKMSHRHDIGLIAQDVQKIFPELTTDLPGQKGKLGVDYAKIVAPIIEAIRELKLENDALKAKVDSLEKRINGKSK